MNFAYPHREHWRKIYRLLHHPALRYVLNLRANIASLSFITCSLPFFLMGEATTGIALSLGSVACGLADTASVNRHRAVDIFITMLLFFINSLAVIFLFSHTLPFVIYLGLSSFILFMLALYSPRLGAIGFATILLGVYAMILHDPTLAVWHLPIALTLGAFWYGLWQWLAVKLLPGREDKDLLYEIFQSLGRKLQSHAWPLTHGGEYNTFVETGRLRAVFSAKFNMLKQRVHQQLSAGENTPLQTRLLSAMRAAESVSEQTRLMHFSPSQAFQQAHHQWLAQINTLAMDLAESLRNYHPSSNSIHMPQVDFNALRQAPNDENFKRETLLALGFIDKLELIYIALKELGNESVKICPASYSQKRCHNWRLKQSLPILWQQFACQMTLNSSYFRHALRGALCLTAGLILVRAFQLEFGFWTLMTSLLVLKPNLSMTWSRLLHRLGGTLSGLAVVALMLHWQVHNLTLMLVFCIATIGFFHTTARQYGISVFFVTLFVFSGFALNGQGDVILLPRLENTLLGVALPVLFVLFIAPGWQRHAFPSQLLTTIASYLQYLNILKQQLTCCDLEQINTDSTNSKALDDCYQQCVINDTNLFDHWLGYLLEPRPNSKISEAIVLCCHSSNIMLRLLTQLHQHKKDTRSETLNELEKTINAFSQLHKLLLKSYQSPHFFNYLIDHQSEITPQLREIEYQGEHTDTAKVLALLRKELATLSGY